MQSPLPSLTSTNDTEALHEIHVFLRALNPSEEELKKYNTAVEEWNSVHSDAVYKMKPCFLALVFRDSDGNENVVKVMQSARYIRGNDTTCIVDECHRCHMV